jgi:regulator of RNase E activity RraB
LNFEADVTKRGLIKSLVYASHVSDLRDETVTAFLTTVVGVAEKHSGVYDGFGAYLQVD